jgi:hypothetical protein
MPLILRRHDGPFAGEARVRSYSSACPELGVTGGSGIAIF